MKRISLLLAVVTLITLVFAFTGCETTVSINGDTTNPNNETTKKEPDTAVVEVTDEDGTVVDTQTVTMSKQDKETEKNFFTVDKEPSKPGISVDRLNQALQLTKPTTSRDNEENEAPDINGENDGSFNEEETDASVDAPFVQDDAAILNSSQYMISVRVVAPDGTIESYKIARKNKTSSISFIYNDNPMSFIMGGETWYWLSNTDKSYLKIPRKMIEENATDEEMKNLLLGDPFNFNRAIKTKTTEVIDGTEYNVTVYEDGTKDYFIGKMILQTTSPDGSVMYYDAVSAVAPSSLFTPPADYVEIELTDDSAGDMLDAIAPSTEEHSHAE